MAHFCPKRIPFCPHPSLVNQRPRHRTGALFKAQKQDYNGYIRRIRCAYPPEGISNQIGQPIKESGNPLRPCAPRRVCEFEMTAKICIRFMSMLDIPPDHVVEGSDTDFVSFPPLKSDLREAKFRAPLLSEKGVDIPNLSIPKLKHSNISEDVAGPLANQVESPLLEAPQSVKTWTGYTLHRCDSVPNTTCVRLRCCNEGNVTLYLRRP